jgi:hypothetical protein
MRHAQRSRLLVMSFAVAVIVLAGAPRRTRADSLLDFKTLYYAEDGGRIRVIAPMAAVQSEWGDAWTIRVEGIYNSISGATPTGAPAVGGAPASLAPAKTVVRNTGGPVIVPDDDDEDEDEAEDKGGRSAFKSGAASKALFNSMAGATPPPPPPPPPPKPGKTPTSVPAPAPASTGGKVPTADFDDTRVGANLDLSRKIGRHTPTLALAYSQEDDYLSRGVALKDAIEFNKKNTILLTGLAGTFDDINPANGRPDDTKTTYDLLLGVTQVLNPVTLATLSATIGRTDGYLSDPYKVVELNGVLVPEERPDSKDKYILYGSLVRYVEPLNGSLETSYRFYSDTFGINSHTLSAAWYQKIGEHWVVRPLVRYYTQTEADFYGVRFTGSPSEYSSDYRVSEMSSFGGGLKVIWTPNSRVSFDISYERYEQQGLDNETPDELYPAANMIMVGARLWF